MSDRHILFVCTSCASAHRTKQAIRRSGGERLLEQLQSLHQASPLSEFSIQPIECLSACEQDCAITLIAAGKPTYLLGKLPVEEDRIESAAEAAMAFASQYRANSDGNISYLKCPELLKKRVLAKIPSVPIPTLERSSGL
jgi:predicted metal-binding protein